MERVIVHPSRRFLMTENGQPFFWMGDTAWELFHRCTRDQIGMYLENRARKGFNVIQAVALPELDGLRTPNMEGELPLHDLDPEQPNEAYFDLVDFTIQLAAEKGLYIALLPTWGDKVTLLWGAGPVVFTIENARVYGRWLAQRYQDVPNVLWVLGGDRPPVKDGEDWRPIWRSMAAGIREVLGEKALLSYHNFGDPNLEIGAKVIHGEAWSDLVMIQSGHGATEIATWDQIETLYHLQPPKPVLDSEICYEDHPIAPWPKWDPANGYFRDYEVRKQMYRSVFAGAPGVTYGHHHVWQMWDHDRQVVNNGFELRPWYDALDRPGAFQVRHLVNLMLSHDPFARIPDQSMILSAVGDAGAHIRAARSSRGEYAMVYLPQAQQQVRLDLRSLRKPYHLLWFDPRTGTRHPIEDVFSNDEITLSSPLNGPDWVLLLETV
ncbi:MAG: glycoside hydrolase family 140 protein [Anaerolineae bacterium]|nr:glycoside hydrolase family 140 protein [Anaerolineae bacterium]